MTFLLLQVILQITKLEYISRRGLPLAVPAPVTQVSSGFWCKSHCHGNLSVEKQDKELCAFLSCCPVVSLLILSACLIIEVFSR